MVLVCGELYDKAGQLSLNPSSSKLAMVIELQVVDLSVLAAASFRIVIKLWHHLWCGGCILREAFPELYSFSCNKESYLADVMSFPNQRLHWDLRFYREPQD